MRYPLVKVLLTVSLFRPSFPPQLNVFPHHFNFSDHLPDTTRVVSHCCELFVVAKNINSFAIKQIRTLCAKNRVWGTPTIPIARPSLSLCLRASVANVFFSATCSLSSLCALFRTRLLCFQWFAASFRKTPGWGYLDYSGSPPLWSPSVSLANSPADASYVVSELVDL